MSQIGFLRHRIQVRSEPQANVRVMVSTQEMAGAYLPVKQICQQEDEVIG